jgi:phosphoglycerol transferase MdoB-like AlkP superfamily enzyme
MLANFISKIKKSKVGENTFIVFTGDHNFWDIFRFNTDENYSKRKVPLYIHIPSKYKNLDYSNYTKKFSTTIDIMPTLYPLTLSNTEFVSFGQNLFSDSKTYSMNSANLIANESGLFSQGKFYVWSSDAGALTREANEVESKTQVLDPVYRSMISIHELFLRNELKTK